jgi:hypothetical protein
VKTSETLEQVAARVGQALGRTFAEGEFQRFTIRTGLQWYQPTPEDSAAERKAASGFDDWLDRPRERSAESVSMPIRGNLGAVRADRQ